MTELPFSAAADRNKQPILDVLRTVLGERGSLLEIASGTGQHAAWFAAALRNWRWQPSDADAGMLPLLAERVTRSESANLQPPVRLDVTDASWPSEGPAFERGFDAIFCANMLHIAPPAACVGLMQGAARHLMTTGLLITYGPYFEDGTVAPSNLAFDESLRRRNAAWGILRLADVEAEAKRAGLILRQRHAMPANNLLLVFSA